MNTVPHPGLPHTSPGGELSTAAHSSTILAHHSGGRRVNRSKKPKSITIESCRALRQSSEGTDPSQAPLFLVSISSLCFTTSLGWEKEAQQRSTG